MKSDPRFTQLVMAWVLIIGWLVALAMFNLLRGVTIAGIVFPLSLLPIAAIITVTVMLRRRSPGARIAASVVLGWMLFNGAVFFIRSQVLGHFPLSAGKIIFFLVIEGLNALCLLYLWGNRDGNPLAVRPDPPTVENYFE